MPSLLTDAEKAELEAITQDVADTFARPIVYYKFPQEVVLVESSNHNFLYEGAGSNTSIQYVQQSGIMNARILHGKKQDLASLRILGNLAGGDHALLQEGECRIKIDATGKAIFENAQRVIIDDEPYEFNSARRPHGLFSPKFMTYYLKKTS